jgi:DNA-binding transcriptional regulator YhcF (GntR family)
LSATAKSDFEVVRKNKVYEEVAQQIERLILKKLQPGDKLPSERELAELPQFHPGCDSWFGVKGLG